MQTAIKNDFKLVRSTNLTRHIPPSVIDEIERGILVETDYLNEARNIDFFRDALKPLDYVRVPRVYWNLTTDRVLTMSFVEGVLLSQLLTHKPTQQVRNHLGRNLLELFLFQIYHVRALHADPHPGNYLFNADGHIGLVDFGCVKMFSRDMAELIHCFLNRAWLQGDRHIDRMMRLLWPKVSPSNEKARAILLTEIDLFNMLYPLLGVDSVSSASATLRFSKAPSGGTLTFSSPDWLNRSSRFMSAPNPASSTIFGNWKRRWIPTICFPQSLTGPARLKICGCIRFQVVVPSGGLCWDSRR